MRVRKPCCEQEKPKTRLHRQEQNADRSRVKRGEGRERGAEAEGGGSEEVQAGEPDVK